MAKFVHHSAVLTPPVLRALARVTHGAQVRGGLACVDPRLLRALLYALDEFGDLVDEARDTLLFMDRRPEAVDWSLRADVACGALTPEEVLELRREAA